MHRDRREWLVIRAPGAPERNREMDGAAVRVGRAAACEIVLADEYVSAEHAEIVEQRGERCVRDLGSRNGTRLNGRWLPAQTAQPLRDGDVIQVGACELTFRRVEVAEGIATPERSAGRRWLSVARVVLMVAIGCIVAAALVGGGLWLLAPPRVALLVLGGDARPDELRRGEQGRTDTILAVVADRSPPGVVLISIPRDLWVQIPGFGWERINVAYSVGGPEAAKATVRQTLGVPIDGYLLIGLQGVRDLVDAVGGVEIDVAQAIYDPFYPTDDYRTMVVDIPAGRQRMDGETALRYARTRYQDSDFGRVARQQQVLVALRDAMLRPGNWWRLPGVLQAARRSTQSDAGLLDLTTLAVAVARSPVGPDRLTIDLSLVNELTGADGAYLLTPRPALRERVAAVLSPRSAGVEVLNGTETAGLAGQAAERLRNEGMRVARVGNAPGHQGETLIEVRPGFKRAGAHVAALLEVSLDAMREISTLPEGIDVRITLGDESFNVQRFQSLVER